MGKKEEICLQKIRIWGVAMTKEQKKFIDEIGRCELCGSRRNLQLHHIIPMVCENEFIDLDIEDNWLCVCGSCHAKLTPKNILVKYGISKVKENNKKILKRTKFLKAVYAELDDGIRLTPVEILDIFHEVYYE